VVRANGDRLSVSELRVYAEIEAEASEEEIAAVRVTFTDAGLDVEINAGLMRFSDGPLPWHLALGIHTLKELFESGLVGAAGAEGWMQLKRLIGALYAARRNRGKPDGVIRLDADGGRRIELPDDLPDEAYRALERGEPEERGIYVWDPETSTWQNWLDR
jgi:hypothetical protein